VAWRLLVVIALAGVATWCAISPAAGLLLIAGRMVEANRSQNFFFGGPDKRRLHPIRRLPCPTGGPGRWGLGVNSLRAIVGWAGWEPTLSLGHGRWMTAYAGQRAVCAHVSGRHATGGDSQPSPCCSSSCFSVFVVFSPSATARGLANSWGGAGQVGVL